MKFCKLTQIQPEDDMHAIRDENLPPNMPLPPTLKPTVEPSSQEELYRGEIEGFLLGGGRTGSVAVAQNYWGLQVELSEHMRGVLLNWLVEVHQKYKLMGETYFLMVRLIDLYLSVEPVPRARLQLLGITALWVATKYTETYQVPKIQNLVYICDNAYRPEDILAMEGRLLLATGFHTLVGCSPLTHFEMVQHHARLAEKDYWLGRYLLEAATFDLALMRFPPSVLAYALSFFIKRLRGYSTHGEESLRALSGATETEVRAVAREVCSLWQRAEHLECLNGLRTKYSQRQFMEVAKIRLTERTR